MSSKLLYDKVIYCIVFVVVELSLIPTYGQQGRVTTNFDKNWKFYLGDIVGAEKLSFDDIAGVLLMFRMIGVLKETMILIILLNGEVVICQRE